ncbi:hypothetical protein LIER_15008 [Lithospermum erythrorhizon]|uniref:Peptidase A2 domain-containing protein n=1 Tax=Lithospermum erythrorhizon TaxID=34254 RepID=A0AAV3Q6G8_LITER
MLVDTGSWVDILYISTFDKLQLPRSLIQPLSTQLTGFTGHSINTMGVVPLDLTVGSGLKAITINAHFTVVDIEDQSYNGLIGVGGIQRKRTRENHLEINSVKVEGEEKDNSPKERESKKKKLCHMRRKW